MSESTATLVRPCSARRSGRSCPSSSGGPSPCRSSRRRVRRWLSVAEHQGNDARRRLSSTYPAALDRAAPTARRRTRSGDSRLAGSGGGRSEKLAGRHRATAIARNSARSWRWTCHGILTAEDGRRKDRHGGTPDGPVESRTRNRESESGGLALIVSGEAGCSSRLVVGWRGRYHLPHMARRAGCGRTERHGIRRAPGSGEARPLLHPRPSRESAALCPTCSRACFGRRTSPVSCLTLRPRRSSRSSGTAASRPART